MRKVLPVIIGLYVGAALVTRAAEAKGVPRFQCGCEPDCWCKRPGVAFPLGHATPKAPPGHEPGGESAARRAVLEASTGTCASHGNAMRRLRVPRRARGASPGL